MNDNIEKYLFYSGISTFGHYPHTRELKDVDIVVMGVPFDAGVTNRSGARMGPRAIRNVSNLVFAFNSFWNTETFSLEKACPNIIDYGDVGVSCGNNAISHMLKDTYIHAKKIFAANANLLTLGGDHTIPYGMIRAAKEKYGKIAMLHFDSHQDSIPSNGNYTHANFAYDLWKEGCIDAKHSAQVYIRTDLDNEPGYKIFYAPDAIEMGPKALAKELKAIVKDMPVYITFDIDCLDPAFAPGTGTPVSGGPTSSEVRRLLRNLEGIRLIGADIVCVAPPYDHSDITALAGASVAQDLMCLMAKNRIKE